LYAFVVLHELWIESEQEQTFCLAGLLGEDARKLLTPQAKLVWTVEANSHFEAMTLYYAYMGWRDYTTDYPEWDKKSYKELGWE
jgi:hypothetical protein